MGKLVLITQIKRTPKGSRVSSDTKLNSVRPSNSLRMKLELKLKLLNKSVSQSARLQLFLVKWKKVRLFLTDPTAPNANWSLLSTQCRQKLMECLLQPRTQRKKPRKLWLMLHALQMSSDLSKIILLLWLHQRILWPINLVNWKAVSLTQRLQQCGAEKLQWQNLR